MKYTILNMGWEVHVWECIVLVLQFKIKKYIKLNGFIDFKDIEENIVVCNFNDNTFKQGIVNLNSKQLERISFLLAHDLKTFAQINSNFSILSANTV